MSEIAQPTIQVADQVMQDSAKSSYAAAKLPSGYLDDDNVVHRDVFLREMTGVEEDILTSVKVPVGKRFAKILENCVVELGPYNQKQTKWQSIIKSLTAGDQLFLLVQIRIQSLGPIFSAKCVCPECGHKSMENVDLNDFMFSPIKDGKRTFSGTLPKSGKQFTAKVLTGYDEEKIAKMKKNDPVTMAMYARMIELDNKTPVSVDMVKALTMMDRQYLRKQFALQEGEVDKSIEYTCANCEAEVKHDISIASPGFFFPSDQ